MFGIKFILLQLIYVMLQSMDSITANHIAENLNAKLDYDFKLEYDFKYQFMHLMQAIDAERKVEDILLLKVNAVEDCLFESMLEALDLPFMSHTMSYIKKATEMPTANKIYTQECLILVCMQKNIQIFFEILKTVPKLKPMHNNRFLIYYAANVTNALTSFCESCFKADVYNVQILTPKFLADSTYYSCQKYPPLKKLYKQKFLNKTAEIFPNQFLDMHGGVITTQPIQVVPYSFRRAENTGKPTLIGYMSKVLTTYAARRNATLKTTIESSHLRQIVEAAIDGYVDFAIIPYYERDTTLSHTSYPYTVDKLCFLIPLQGYLPIKRIFFNIIHYESLLIILLLILCYDFLLKHSIKPLQRRFNCYNYWFNDKCLRLLLAQTITYPRPLTLKATFVWLQIFLFSLWLNTAYQAYLQSWLTQAPLMPRLQSAAELEAINLKANILNWPFNDDLLGPVKSAHLQLITYADDLEESVKNYYIFDTRYAYPLPLTQWQALKAQQQNFGQQLFYYADTFCTSQLELLRFPLRPRLPYRELFNYFLLKVHDSGLYRLWLGQSFHEMVRAKLATFKDSSTSVKFGEPLTINDFSYILLGYVALMAASVLIFGVEIIYKIKECIK